MKVSVGDAPVRAEAVGFQASRNKLQVVWERKWLVVLGLVVGVVVGGLVYVRSRPVYRSQSQVLVIKKQSPAMPSASGDPTQSYMEDYVSTHIVLLKSPVIIEKAIRKGKLTEFKTFEGQGNPASVLMASLGATRDLTAGTGTSRTIINLTYQGPVAEESGKVLEAVIGSYEDFLAEAYRAVSADTEKLIAKAGKLLRTDLAYKEQQYRDFRESGPLLWKSKDGVNIHQARILEIETKRSALLVRKAELDGRLRAIEEARKAGKTESEILPTLAEPKADTTAKTEGSKAEEQLFLLVLEEEELLQNYGEGHPSVQSVRAKMKRARRVIEKDGLGVVPLKDVSLVERTVRSMRHELEQAEVLRHSLEDLLKEEQKEAKGLSRIEMTDEQHRLDIARTQQLYDQTIKRLQEINLVRDFGGYDARIISPPGIGTQIAPNLGRVFSVAVVLGLLGGVGLAFLADITDRSFRSPEEVRRRLSLPIMGHIPYLAATVAAQRKEAAAIGEGVGLAPTLCVHHRPASMEAEAYRSLRTAFFFGTQGESHQVIQMTSPNMGDGKTTLICNLAVSIAQSGKRVVLIDADFRRPRLHRAFGLPAGAAGLTSVLAGESALAGAVHPTPVPGLSVVPCGARPSNPAELLTSPAFGRVIGELRGQYDYVLVDTPPLLAVTDPCIVAGRVDAVLLTVRLAKNGRPAAERAKELLINLGVQVMGVIVNGVGGDGAQGYGYRYYDYQEYRYEYRGTDEPAPQTVVSSEAKDHVVVP